MEDRARGLRQLEPIWRIVRSRWSSNRPYICDLSLHAVSYHVLPGRRVTHHGSHREEFVALCNELLDGEAAREVRGRVTTRNSGLATGDRYAECAVRRGSGLRAGDARCDQHGYNKSGERHEC